MWREMGTRKDIIFKGQAGALGLVAAEQESWSETSSASKITRSPDDLDLKRDRHWGTCDASQVWGLSDW